MRVAKKTAKLFFVFHGPIINDCGRPTQCLQKDLDPLLFRYTFPKPLWQAVKTTNAAERIHKELKRLSRPLEGIGEVNLETLLAFTALRMEMTWKRRTIDTYAYDHLTNGQEKLPTI